MGLLDLINATSSVWPPFTRGRVSLLFSITSAVDRSSINRRAQSEKDFRRKTKSQDITCNAHKALADVCLACLQSSSLLALIFLSSVQGSVPNKKGTGTLGDA